MFEEKMSYGRALLGDGPLMSIVIIKFKSRNFHKVVELFEEEKEQTIDMWVNMCYKAKLYNVLRCISNMQIMRFDLIESEYDAITYGSFADDVPISYYDIENDSEW